MGGKRSPHGVSSSVKAELERTKAHVRALIEQSGRTHKEVARRAGIEAPTLERLLAPDRSMKYEVLFKVLAAIDVSEAHFFSSLYDIPIQQSLEALLTAA